MSVAPRLALLALLGLVACSAPVRERDQPLPELPIARLDGSPIRRAHFTAQPWVIAVWMPG